MLPWTPYNIKMFERDSINLWITDLSSVGTPQGEVEGEWESMTELRRHDVTLDQAERRMSEL